jgi:Ner family transcriptional regulator
MQNDMPPETVKKRILATGITLSELGIQNGFSSAAVSITWKKRQPFVQQMIADRLRMKPQEIWPSRYDENGSPIRLDPRGRQLGGISA